MNTDSKLRKRGKMVKIIKTPDGYFTDKGVPVEIIDETADNKEPKEEEC